MSQAACGLPDTFSGRAYPVLVGAVDWSGRRASAIWGRALPFPLPLSQSGSLRASRHPSGWAYPVLFCAGVKCGRRASADWGRALPFPLPLTPEATPQSRCGVTAPLTFFAPKCPERAFRCSVRLIELLRIVPPYGATMFRSAYLTSSKRSGSNRFRGLRKAQTLGLQPLCGLRRGAEGGSPSVRCDRGEKDKFY